MAGGIDVAQRIVPHVRVAVERLRIERARHDRVGLEEAAEGRVVEARPVVVEAHAALEPLAGEVEAEARRGVGALRNAEPAVGLVDHPLEHRAVAAGHERRAAEVIAVAVDDAREGARPGRDLGAIGEAVAIGVGVGGVGALGIHLGGIEHAVAIGVGIAGAAAEDPDLLEVAEPVAVGVDPERARARGHLFVRAEQVLVDVDAADRAQQERDVSGGDGVRRLGGEVHRSDVAAIELLGRSHAPAGGDLLLEQGVGGVETTVGVQVAVGDGVAMTCWRTRLPCAWTRRPGGTLGRSRPCHYVSRPRTHVEDHQTRRLAQDLRHFSVALHFAPECSARHR